MDTETAYWIALVVFAAVVFSIVAFTAGKLSADSKPLFVAKPAESDIRSEIVALRCQVEELRFELRRSNYRNFGSPEHPVD